MVLKYIKKLLFEHNCVIIPKFGGLITNYGTASIHPVSNFLTPPVKKLAFNESLQSNDGLLINAIAVGERVSEEAAALQVKYFVKKITDQLKQKETVKLEGVGNFLYNEEEHIQFISDESVNYLEESFGLTELYFKPIDREEEDMKRIRPTQGRPVVRKAPTRKPGATTSQKLEKKKEGSSEEPVEELSLTQKTEANSVEKKQPSKGKKATEKTVDDNKDKKKEAKSLLFLIIPVVLILGAGGVYYYISQHKTEDIEIAAVDNEEANSEENIGEASLVETVTSDVESTPEEPETSSVEVNETMDEEVIPEIEETTAIEEVPVEEVPVKEVVTEEIDHTPTTGGSHGKTYVIAGVFVQKRKADRYANKFSNGTVLNHEGKYRVAIAEYGTATEAKQDINNLKAEHGDNLWILEY